MNLFDIVAGLVLIVSALIGYGRGAVLEVVTLVAFTVAAALSVYLLPYTAMLAHAMVHPVWAANAVAVAVAFLIAYLGLRIVGDRISQAMRSHATLGPLDRTAGLAFGVVRALVMLGAVYLVFKATPSSQPPPLLTQARLYPLARGAGLTLAQLAPGGIGRLENFGASLKTRMSGEDTNPPPGPVDAGDAYGPTPAGPDEDAAPPRRLRVTSDGAPVAHRRHHPYPSAATQE